MFAFSLYLISGDSAHRKKKENETPGHFYLVLKRPNAKWFTLCPHSMPSHSAHSPVQCRVRLFWAQQAENSIRDPIPQPRDLEITPKGTIWACFSRYHSPDSTVHQPSVLAFSNPLCPVPELKGSTGASNSLNTVRCSQINGTVLPLNTQARFPEHKGTEHSINSGPYTSPKVQVTQAMSDQARRNL